MYNLLWFAAVALCLTVLIGSLYNDVLLLLPLTLTVSVIVQVDCLCNDMEARHVKMNTVV